MSLPFRIALVGAHGTGKTTLSNHLTVKLTAQGKVVAQMPEIPRVICEGASDLTFFRREKNTPLKQTLILLGQACYEVTQMAKPIDILVCDRSLMDHWAYTKYLFSTEFNVNDLDKSYEEFISNYCSSYNIIFYVPIEFPPKDDGTREDDKEFQAAIDKIMCDFLAQHSLPYITITGSIEQRVEQCLEKIESYLRSV